MKDIKNIKKSFFEIAQLLAANEQIQRLLVLDSSDPLHDTFTPKTINELLEEKYITLIPPFLEEGIENNARNTFLVIRIEDIVFTDRDINTNVHCAIMIGTHDNYVMLKNNESRLLELVDRILRTLDGQKLSSAGVISISTCSLVDYTPYVTGYRISFDFADQTGRKAEL